MTPENADQLYAWVQTLSRDQLKHLWRWLFLEWAQRARADPYTHR